MSENIKAETRRLPASSPSVKLLKYRNLMRVVFALNLISFTVGTKGPAAQGPITKLLTLTLNLNLMRFVCPKPQGPRGP